MRLITLWIASVILVALATLAYSQARDPRSDVKVLSGNDIGFRIDGIDSSGKPTGVLVVRSKGEWVEVGSSISVRHLK